MKEWLKKQLTLQNILMVLVLVATMFRNSTAWVMELTTSSGKTAAAVDKLTDQTQRLSDRVDALERLQLRQSELLSVDFPRRSELEPRLKAIEQNGRENNMMLRRFMESYRH